MGWIRGSALVGMDHRLQLLWLRVPRPAEREAHRAARGARVGNAARAGAAPLCKPAEGRAAGVGEGRAGATGAAAVWRARSAAAAAAAAGHAAGAGAHLGNDGGRCCEDSTVGSRDVRKASAVCCRMHALRSGCGGPPPPLLRQGRTLHRVHQCSACNVLPRRSLPSPCRQPTSTSRSSRRVSGTATRRRSAAGRGRSMPLAPLPPDLAISNVI